MAHIKPDQLRSGFYEITGSLYGTASFAISASHVDKAVVTASAVNDTITFTKGDGSTFPVTLTSIATASYALNALSSSYAATASFISTLYSSNYTQSFVNQSTWVVIHNLDTRYVIVQVYDTAFDEIIPQNIDLTNDDTVTITFPTLESGTAVVSVGGALQNSGTISSSYAFNATSASYALTASYFSGSITNAISASYALTASYFSGSITNAVSASYALTASYVTLAQTASYVDPIFISASAAAAGFGSGGGSVTVPGSDTQILFNSASALGASSNFIFNYTLGSLQQGLNNLAPGQYSHAEGQQTTSQGNYSHAEGQQTTSQGNYSHAEGRLTNSQGDYSHTEGNLNIASGFASHAEGTFSTAFGSYSHAEGFRNLASGLSSHAEGSLTTSSGAYSHAEGYSTLASGDSSHTEGYFTTASSNYSHAEGDHTITSAYFQHAQGTYNISSSITGAFIHGNGTSDSNRSNLIFAAGNQVEITGSLAVTGSLVVNGSTQGNVAALTISSNTASVDLTRASFFTITLTSGATTHISASNILPGSTSTILVTTDGTSNVTFPSNVKQPSGSFYTSSAVSAKDILTFISYDSTNLYLASVKNLI
jgi:hypothetical protein